MKKVRISKLMGSIIRDTINLPPEKDLKTTTIIDTIIKKSETNFTTLGNLKASVKQPNTKGKNTISIADHSGRVLFLIFIDNAFCMKYYHRREFYLLIFKRMSKTHRLNILYFNSVKSSFDAVLCNFITSLLSVVCKTALLKILYSCCFLSLFDKSDIINCFIAATVYI